MDNVIDLVSSDNEASIASRPIEAHSSLFGAGSAPSRGNPDLNSDDDFYLPPRVKKRKLELPPESIVLDDTAFDIPVLPQVQRQIKRRSKDLDFTKAIEDDIVFTSSPKRKTKSKWTSIDSQDELSEGSPPAKKKSVLSSTTAALLEDLSASKSTKKQKTKDIKQRESDTDDEKPRFSRARIEHRDKQADKAARAEQREQQRIDKAAEKQAEKLAKQEAQVIKAKAKQREKDIASVNRSKMDKNTTTPEMVVDFPVSMEGTSSLTQAQEFLRKADSKIHLYSSQIPGIIKFRRTIRADFNEELGYWEPVKTPRTDNEKMIVVYQPAEEFARLVSPPNAADETYEQYLVRVRSLHPGHRIIYLIEGLEKLITKEKNHQNRSYQAAVRRAAAATETAVQIPTRKKQANLTVDEAAIEAALLTLQIKHSIQIHHTISPLDTGETILSMTQQLSQARYRDPPEMTAVQMASQPNFCMSTGQVATGKGHEDTYLKILQQVIRVTEREAMAIAKTHGTVGLLFSAFERGGGRVLENIMKTGGGAKGAADGTTAPERRIGPATSERLHRIFMGMEDGETIG